MSIYTNTEILVSSGVKGNSSSVGSKALLYISGENIYTAQNALSLPNLNIKNHNKVFLVLYNAKYGDSKGTLLNYFDKNYKLENKIHFDYIDLFIFTKSNVPTNILL